MKSKLTAAICIFLVFVTSQSLTSCIKSGCRMIECKPYRQFSFQIFGFSGQEANTINLRKYKKGTNFTELIETVIIRKGSNADHIYSEFTPGYISVALHSTIFIESSFDYEFYFPATNTLRRLSNITDIQSQMEYCDPWFQKNYCTNDKISSCLIDGVQHYDGIPAIRK